MATARAPPLTLIPGGQAVDSRSPVIHISDSFHFTSLPATLLAMDSPYRRRGIALVIGNATRRRTPHTRQPPLIKVDPTTLADLKESPQVVRVEVGDNIDWGSALTLPLHTNGLQIVTSYIIVVSDVPTPVDAGPGLRWEGDTRFAIPARSALGSTRQRDESTRLLSLYASAYEVVGLGGTLSLDAPVLHGSGVVAVYGGSLEAWHTFQTFFAAHGGTIRMLTISCTDATALADCRGMAKIIRTGVLASTSLEHLSLSLFVGPNATMSLDDQWHEVLVILASTNPSVLRRVTFVIVVHEDDTLADHLDYFADSPWVEIKRLLLRSAIFQAVTYKVVGARPDVAETIGVVVERGLEGRYSVQYSREPLAATFYQEI